MDLSLWVHLGWTPEEQATCQEVRVSFEIRSHQLPAACTSDRLSGTLCYGTLCERLRHFCTDRRFQTIERLAYGCFEALQPELSAEMTLRVSIHKLKPPVDALLGGASFEIESIIEGKP
jgi:dihydroneopterin aldolase